MRRAKDIRHNTWLSIGEAEHDCRVTFDYLPGCDAQTWGPPERCWPAEPPELEITSVRVDGMEMLEALSFDEMEALYQRLMDDFEAWNPYERYDI